MRIIQMLMPCLLVPVITVAAEKQLETITHTVYVERMAAATASAWPRLATMERLKGQTGFYAQAQILVYDGVSAWLIDANGYRAIAAGPVHALGFSSDYKSFKELLWEGRPTVYMGLGQTLPEVEARNMLNNPSAVPALFALATHEAFHFFGQAGWQLISGSRAGRYPLQAQPRQYRQHLINALYASLQGDPQALGKARYWHDRWQTEFALEAQDIRYYDILEGTAEYIEGLARTFASVAADEPEAWAQGVMARFPSAAALSLDGESYALGALAIYILDRLDANGWQSIIEGQTPVQRLLANVRQSVDVPDAALNRRIAEEISERNRHLARVIDPVITQLKHPDTVRLMVPMSAVAGSISMSGSYQVEEAPDEMLVDFSAQFSPSKGRVTFDRATVALAVSEACGEKSGFVVVPIAASEFPNGPAGRLRLKGAGFEVDAPFPRKGTGSEGVWCIPA
ncbi:hypothetical protein [Pseudomonas sp. 24 E 1]|uniref:hypothetical protein n=1 Tax=unclassified Pseudomonas TaxID=196821 RepID=UPI00081214A9|nr:MULTISPECIES: hypothetical protein [unclassified Pseudomonas]CRM24204.1 hypothetical protein [Pseudomonas sp. 58 R 12]CRM42281.1 hypothetical protein [Pseudomonas sp. 58 R 12]CRM61601.1 hypothetical protein [Pseudomonas sp. 24 E 1]